MYAVNWYGENVKMKSLEILAKLCDENMGKQVREHTEAGFKRITGSGSL